MDCDLEYVTKSARDIGNARNGISPEEVNGELKQLNVSSEDFQNNVDVYNNQHSAQITDSFDLEIAWHKHSKPSPRSKHKPRSTPQSSNTSTPIKGRKRKYEEDEGNKFKETTPKKTTDMPEVLNEMEEEIEKQLDEKATKSNLTVKNVKNILKHVLTNEQVLAMVRHTMNENNSIDDESLEDIPLPKLTRSKAKELLQKQPEIAWSMTPTKRPMVSECQVLIDQELPEDSSDEEYQPNEDELMSTVSDIDFESQPNTPYSFSSTPRPPSNLDCSTQTSATWADDYDTIGQRTRSKFSLSDTDLETLEKTLVPPDITTDMYELDCDDDDWKDFLKQFAEPLRPSLNDTVDDDDEADPEYNLLADEDDEDLDKEELRMDRGVKVSKKELNILMKELMDMYEDYETVIRPDVLRKQTDEEVNLSSRTTEDTQADITDTTETMGNEDTVENCVTSEQRLLLAHQMRKHIQLTALHFVQTCGHPELSHMSEQYKEKLLFLKKSAGGNPQSSFMSENLEAALSLVQDWEEVIKSSEGDKIKQFISKEMCRARMQRKGKKRYECQFPTELLEVVSSSEVITYPLLLPHLPFRCDGFFKTSFFPAEDHLIAIGLEEFMPVVKEKNSLFKNKHHYTDCLTLVCEYLLPTYDLGTVMNHVMKARKCNKGMNPIKYFFQHQKAPGTDHFVITFHKSYLKPLYLQPHELLPEVWKRYNFPHLITAREDSPLSFPPIKKHQPVSNANIKVVYIPVPTVPK